MAAIETNTEQQLQRLLENGVNLPGLAGIGLELMTQLREPQDAIRISRLAEQIETDPSLSARILRIANSPAYGAMRGVTRISQAVVTMGLDETLSLISYYLLRRMFNKAPDVEGFRTEDFWRHSLAVASTARLLGQPRFLVSALPGELYTAGLLHDIGKIILVTHVTEPYGEALAMAREKGFLVVEAERIALEVDHATLAGQLLDNWNLPYSILDSIACHHDPEDAEPQNRERAALIEYADVLAMHCGAPASSWGEIPDLCQTWICRNRPESPLASEQIRHQLELDVTAMLQTQNQVMAHADSVEVSEEETIHELEIQEPGKSSINEATTQTASKARGFWQRLKSWFSN